MFIHVLLVGSALAVAGYGGTLRRHETVTTVSLVGAGSSLRGNDSHQVDSSKVRSGSRPRVSQEKAVLVTSSEATIEKRSATEETSLPRIGESSKNDAEFAYDGDPGKGKAGAEAAGIDPGVQFGLIPAEQWALIESAIEKSKNYPRMARERGIQGVVHVRFKLTPSGDVERVEIIKSSGYDILDDASVRTVYRAVPMPYVNGWVEVPIAYVLK
ncbi:MAG: energy transducer TonB [Betaproteobacteria bacterium]